MVKELWINQGKGFFKYIDIGYETDLPTGWTEKDYNNAPKSYDKKYSGRTQFQGQLMNMYDLSVAEARRIIKDGKWKRIKRGN